MATPKPRHMEVPRLGVKLELHLQVYSTAMATLDLSSIWDLCQSLRQSQIHNPLSEVGIESVSSWILVGFVTAEPQWELPNLHILMIKADWKNQ